MREIDGMKMVYVPEGTFIMGSDDHDAGEDEKPVRNVRLDAFWIDKYEVTNGQYERCVAAGVCTMPSETKSAKQDSYYGNVEFENHPVIYVNWHQAQIYCQWVGGDLPTEAQWEKAARGEDGNKYPWGNESPNSSYANYDNNEGDTTAVGTYSGGRSVYGAMDMAGNVWEWVRDWYQNKYDAHETDNPTGPSGGTYRVLRGGSWYDISRNIRSSLRYYYYPSSTYDLIGFRCVSSP